MEPPIVRSPKKSCGSSKKVYTAPIINLNTSSRNYGLEKLISVTSEKRKHTDNERSSSAARPHKWNQGEDHSSAIDKKRSKIILNTSRSLLSPKQKKYRDNSVGQRMVLSPLSPNAVYFSPRNIRKKGQRRARSLSSPFYKNEISISSIQKVRYNDAILDQKYDKKECKPSMCLESDVERDYPKENKLEEVSRDCIRSESRIIVKSNNSYKLALPSNINTLVPEELRHIYEASIAIGSKDKHSGPQNFEGSHQRQLEISGCSLLSFEDVIIYSVVERLRKDLRLLQAKAQGYGDREVTNIIKLCRYAVIACGTNAAFAIKECRSTREADDFSRFLSKREEKKNVNVQIRLNHQEMKVKRKKKKKEEALFEREQQKILREKEKEKRRRNKKKNWYKNKNNWREVALLMGDLARLQKEEKMWKAALLNLNQQKRNLEQNEDHTNELNNDRGNSGETTENNIEVYELKDVQNMLDNMNVSTNRITGSLKIVSNLIEEADIAQDHLNTKYRKDHKFHGYTCASNPKTLHRLSF